MTQCSGAGTSSDPQPRLLRALACTPSPVCAELLSLPQTPMPPHPPAWPPASCRTGHSESPQCHTHASFCPLTAPSSRCGHHGLRTPTAQAEWTQSSVRPVVPDREGDPRQMWLAGTHRPKSKHRTQRRGCSKEAGEATHTSDSDNEHLHNQACARPHASMAQEGIEPASNHEHWVSLCSPQREPTPGQAHPSLTRVPPCHAVTGEGGTAWGALQGTNLPCQPPHPQQGARATPGSGEKQASLWGWWEPLTVSAVGNNPGETEAENSRTKDLTTTIPGSPWI